MIRTIFFDLDDTLLDFARAEREALTRAFRRFDIDPAPGVLDRYHELNRQQWELLEEGRLTRPQVLLRRFDLLFAELGLDRSSRQVCDAYEAFLAQGHWFIPGAPELLAALAPRYDLYLASNGASAVQCSRLESAGILPYFKDIFISEEVGFDKPSPAFFQAAFAAVPGFSRETALMVGDSLTSDIRGGLNAGIRTCWFDPHDRPPRPDIVPDWRITALNQLPELLEKIDNG
ncbi:MAG: YjjG family noncanonical pyrimidine nucleotidase [Oscillospiraceae bacterium]|nr:YjjG family noncanonical pyrimidine nucleotidase [Oscillospiraceae bacterium]